MIANIELKLYGKPVKLNLVVPEKPVKPVKILPVLHKITNKIVDAAIGSFVEEGDSVSCQAGCGACCRQPVPLAEFEAYQSAELVENMPNRGGRTLKKDSRSRRKLEKVDWFEKLETVLEEKMRRKR